MSWGGGRPENVVENTNPEQKRNLGRGRGSRKSSKKPTLRL